MSEELGVVSVVLEVESEELGVVSEVLEVVSEAAEASPAAVRAVSAEV